MINCFWNAKLYEMVSVTVSMVHRFFEWAWWSIFGTNSAAFIGTTGADVDESRRDFRTGCNDWVIEFIRDCRFFGRLLRWPTARCSRWSTSVDRRRWSQRSRPSQARAAKRFASPRRSLEATRFVFSWFYKKLASGWVPLYGFLEQTRARARARVCMCVCVCVCVVVLSMTGGPWRGADHFQRFNWPDWPERQRRRDDEDRPPKTSPSPRRLAPTETRAGQWLWLGLDQGCSPENQVAARRATRCAAFRFLLPRRSFGVRSVSASGPIWCSHAPAHRRRRNPSDMTCRDRRDRRLLLLLLLRLLLRRRRHPFHVPHLTSFESGSKPLDSSPRNRTAEPIDSSSKSIRPRLTGHAWRSNACIQIDSTWSESGMATRPNVCRDDGAEGDFLRGRHERLAPVCRRWPQYQWRRA